MRSTRHRRRFHTDRIVKVRRARYLREMRHWSNPGEAWLKKHLSYGRLATRDPWDCGVTRCGICHYEQWDPRRAREERAWRKDWDR